MHTELSSLSEHHDGTAASSSFFASITQAKHHQSQWKRLSPSGRRGQTQQVPGPGLLSLWRCVTPGGVGALVPSLPAYGCIIISADDAALREPSRGGSLRVRLYCSSQQWTGAS